MIESFIQNIPWIVLAFCFGFWETRIDRRIKAVERFRGRLDYLESITRPLMRSGDPSEYEKKKERIDNLSKLVNSMLAELQKNGVIGEENLYASLVTGKDYFEMVPIRLQDLSDQIQALADHLGVAIIHKPAEPSRIIAVKHDCKPGKIEVKT